MLAHGPRTRGVGIGRAGSRILRLDGDQIWLAGEGLVLAGRGQAEILGKSDLLDIGAKVRVQDVHVAIAGGDVEMAAIGSEGGLNRSDVAGQ